MDQDSSSYYNVTDENVNKLKHFDHPALSEINEELCEYFTVIGVIENYNGDFSKCVRNYSDQNRF